MKKKEKKDKEGTQDPRRVARELALLSLSQINNKLEKFEQQDWQDLLTIAIETLSSEVKEAIETAADEVRRSRENLLKSQTRASSVDNARVMLTEALELTQKSINRLGVTLELPKFIDLSNKNEVQNYAFEIITTVSRRHQEIEEVINSALVNWQLNRLPKIDGDIIKIAVAEIWFLHLQEKIAINEAVELAKRYSDEDGYRFINGVLRRVTDKLKAEALI